MADKVEAAEIDIMRVVRPHFPGISLNRFAWHPLINKAKQNIWKAPENVAERWHLQGIGNHGFLTRAEEVRE